MTTSKTRPKYESPKVVTYQEDEILKQMGAVGGCVAPTYDPGILAPKNPFGRNSGKSNRRHRSSLRPSRLSDFEDAIGDDEDDL